MEKFLKIAKINSFPLLNSLEGSTKLISAYSKNNFTINISKVKGADYINVTPKDIPISKPNEELIIDSQEITINIDTNIVGTNGGFRSWSLTGRYGERGDKGITGPVGQTGDQGESAINDDEEHNYIKIVNNLTNSSSSDLLSALQGNLLNTFVNYYDSELISQSKYEDLHIVNADYENEFLGSLTKLYYTIDESHSKTGKQYSITKGYIWDNTEETSDENYYIDIDSSNNDIIISNNGGTVDDHILVVNNNVGYIDDHTFIINKYVKSDSTSIINNISNSEIELNNNVELTNNTIIINNGNDYIEGNTLVINK